MQLFSSEVIRSTERDIVVRGIRRVVAEINVE